MPIQRYQPPAERPSLLKQALPIAGAIFGGPVGGAIGGALAGGMGGAAQGAMAGAQQSAMERKVAKINNDPNEIINQALPQLPELPVEQQAIVAKPLLEAQYQRRLYGPKGY